MPLYPYETQLVVDSDGSHVVLPDAAVGIYDPDDTTLSNPLALIGPTGLALSNPLQASPQGFLPAFQTSLPQVMWSGGGFHGYLSSYRGMLDEVIAARDAAQQAATAAQAGSVAPTDDAVDEGLVRAGVVSAWVPSKSYALDQFAVSPGGRVVKALSAHVSGATFDPQLWKDGELADATVVSTTSYTVAAAMANEIVELSASSAVTVTIPTVATAGWTVGTVLSFCQYGAGQVTFVGASGVTLRTPRSLTTRARYSTVRMRMRATNEWVLEGDLT